MADSDGMAYADIFEAWVSEGDKQNIEGYSSPNGLYSMDHLSTVVFVVNEELEAELGLNIQSYADLLDPALQGKVLMADPASSSSAWNNLCNIMSIFGVDSDEAWDYIERLMPNLVMAGSSSATFNSIVQGEYVVGLTYENGAAIPLSNGADNIRLVYPTEGVSAAASGVAVIKNCPHPAAAKAFVDTLMTAEAQTIASEVDTGTRFTNKNMTLSDACVLPSSDSITWVDRPVAELCAQKETILEHWNSLWASLNS